MTPLNRYATYTLLILGALYSSSLQSCSNESNATPRNGASLMIPDLAPREGTDAGSIEFVRAQGSIVKGREAIKRSPADPRGYVELAQIYLQESRATGRHGAYLPVALALLDTALARDPKNFDAMILKASTLMSQHRFDEALELATRAVESNRHSSFAYGVLVDAYVEMGRYDDAVRACDTMMSIRPDLRAYSRASYLRQLHGDLPGAIEALKLAVDAGAPGTEERSWALFTLGGLYLDIGSLDTAERIFTGIIEERPGYAYPYDGLADVRMEQGRMNEALDLFQTASRLTPDHHILEGMAVYYRSTGDTARAAEYRKRVFDALLADERNGWKIDHEYASFALEHDVELDEALRRAERDYKRRPENIEACETYAWALHKSGRTTEARPIMTKALRLKTTDSELVARAEAIGVAAGR